jgi:hypothetical protein
VAKCIADGLGGRGIFIDACLIKAAVDKKKGVPGDRPKAEEASRALAQLPERNLRPALSASSAALLGWARARSTAVVSNGMVPDLTAVVLSRVRIHYR